MAKYEAKLEHLEAELTRQKQELTTKMNEEQVKKILNSSIQNTKEAIKKAEEIAKKCVETQKHIDTKIQQVETTAQKIEEKAEGQTSDSRLMREINEKKAKECNVIIYNITEPESNLKEEIHNEDKSFLNGLFEIVNKPILKENFSKAFRLGKNKTTKPRPLLVCFNSTDHKNDLMNSLGKLKHAEPKYKQIRVAHDLTDLEREEIKKLLNQAREEDQAKNFYINVRGPPWALKIVKTPKTNHNLPNRPQPN
jgi:hypothetical protein